MERGDGLGGGGSIQVEHVSVEAIPHRVGQILGHNIGYHITLGNVAWPNFAQCDTII